MAEEYGFFDGDNYYGEAEFSRYFKNMFRSGVSVDETTGLMTLPVTKQSDTVFRVGSGFAIIEGYYYANTEYEDLTISQASGNTEKNTRIYLGLDLSDKTITLYSKSATGSNWSTTLAPQRSAGVYELALARVNEKNGVVTLIDERSNIDLCGAIRPKNLTEWDTWFDEQQGGGWRNIYIQSSPPEDPVSGAIWIQPGNAI